MRLPKTDSFYTERRKQRTINEYFTVSYNVYDKQYQFGIYREANNRHSFNLLMNATMCTPYNDNDNGNEIHKEGNKDSTTTSYCTIHFLRQIMAMRYLEKKTKDNSSKLYSTLG